MALTAVVIVQPAPLPIRRVLAILYSGLATGSESIAVKSCPSTRPARQDRITIADLRDDMHICHRAKCGRKGPADQRNTDPFGVGGLGNHQNTRPNSVCRHRILFHAG